jgi:hypothetical protein
VTGWSPSAPLLCWRPKSGGLFRPGVLLTPEDEVVFNLLVGRLLPVIADLVADLQGAPDVAYQLATDVRTVQWARGGLKVWKEWRERSVARLDEGFTQVAVSDITGFYDNIDIGRLIRRLQDLTDQNDVLGLLSSCLNRWAGARGRGIPQGHSASDVLAKVYVEPIDRMLQDEGLVHLRYVDDIRIFAHSELEASRAIALLSRLAYREGLSLQSAKTEIKAAADARPQFEGVEVIIRETEEALAAEVEIDLTQYDPSLSPWEIIEALADSEGPAPEVLERVFQQRFQAEDAPTFDKTLFHYLLPRLGAAGSNIAVQFALATIYDRPEETAYILRYVLALGPTDEVLEQLSVYFTSEFVTGDYQVFEFLRWLSENDLRCTGVEELVREVAFDANRPRWLRSWALAYLSGVADQTDFERLQDLYPRLPSGLESADVLAALRRAETGARKEFFGRARDDGDLEARAITRLGG